MIKLKRHTLEDNLTYMLIEIKRVRISIGFHYTGEPNCKICKYYRIIYGTLPNYKKSRIKLVIPNVPVTTLIDLSAKVGQTINIPNIQIDEYATESEKDRITELINRNYTANVFIFNEGD